jgi:hypothetical protein
MLLQLNYGFASKFYHNNLPSSLDVSVAAAHQQAAHAS